MKEIIRIIFEWFDTPLFSHYHFMKKFKKFR